VGAGAPVEESLEERLSREQQHEKAGEHLATGGEADVGLAIAGLALEEDADGGAPKKTCHREDGAEAE
jgi:hypothetical protein